MNSKVHSAISVNEQHLFNALLESSPMLVAYLDPQFDFIQVNSAYAEADEKQPSDFPGKNHFDLYPNDENLQIFQKVVETGQPYQIQAKPFEYQKNKERGVSWWDWSLVPVKDDGGIVTGLILSLVDVTTHKHSEEALAQSEERFKRLFQLAPLSYQSLDETGNFLEVNDTWCQTLGYSREEVIGRNFSVFIDPDFRDIYQRCFPKFKNEGLLEGVELTMIKKDGARIIASFVGQVGYNEDGSFKQTHCIFADITERKQAEEALKESERRLSLHLRNTPIAVIEWNHKFEVVEWNTAAESVFGFTREEALGRHAAGLLVPESARKHVDRVWKNLLENTGGIHSTNDNVTKDGRAIVCEWNNTPLIDESGQVNGVASLVQDITESRRSSDALRGSEEKYRDLVETSQDLIWKCDAEGKFTYLNQAWEKTLGYTTKEMLGRPFSDFQRPEVYERDVKEFARHLTGGFVKGYETSHVTKSGTDVHLIFNAIPIFDNDKNIIGTQGTAFDITARKQAEEALRESEEKHRELIENLPQRIFHKDANLVYVSCNEHFARDMGLAPDEIAGKTDFDLYPRELAEKYREEDRRLMASGQTEEIEESSIKEGQEWFVQTVKTPLTDDSGNVSGILGIFWDITERKRAEEALLASEEQFRSLVSGNPDHLTIYRCDGMILYVHTPEDWKHNISRDHKAGSFLADVHKPGFAKKIQERIDLVLESCELQTYKFSVTRDGDTYYYEARYTPLGPDTVAAILRNTTERKRAEEALRESEENYRALFNAGQDAISVVQINANGSPGNFIAVNDLACRMWGYSRDELLQMRPVDLRDPTVPADDTTFRREMKEKGHSLFERTNLTKDGRQVPVEVNSHFFHLKGRPVYLAISRDITERKRAEEALRESEERFRSIIENTDVGYFFIDQEGIFRDVNAAWVRMYKYASADDIIGEHFTVIQKADDVEKSKAFVAGIMAGDTRFLDGEFSRKCKDGSIGYHTFSARPVFRLGNVVGIEGFIIDSTERKLAEEALRTSEERFRTQMVQSPMVMEIYDIDGLQIEVNRAYEELWGFPASTTVNKFNLLKSKEVEETGLMQYVTRAYAGEAVTVPEYKFDPSGATESGGPGRVRWLSTKIYPLKDSSGNVTNIVITHEDITERKQAKEALQESEEKFRTYISHAPDAIFIADPQGQYVDVNEAACRLTGYSREELTSMSITDLTDPEHSSEAQARFENFTDTGSLSTESRFRRKDGTTVSVSLDAVVLSEGLYMAFCSDITETKRLRELESRAQRLETAGQIAGQVAHDFNNLLAPLMAYPEFIRDELGAGHSALHYLDDIENASRQIADINQQLLTLGRRGHYNQEVMNLNDVVSQAVRQMESLPKTLVVDTQLDKNLMNIKGGRSQVFRAISNLLLNAREAMQDIGQLTVRTENYYVDEIWINYARVPQGEYVKLTISDTGCGIPDEIKQKIFEPFFTTKTADKKRGSGLGISVVDAVIKDHEGYIDLASKTGEGTSFFIYFPVTRDSISSPLHHEIVGGQESILIVDDDEVQRDVSIRLLSSLGYQATAVASGEEAVSALGDQAYDLLVLDMIMPPGIDGAETYRRTLLTNPDQKAIIVSGFAESDRVAAALKMGTGAFVKKPLTRRRLATAVRDELDRVTKPS